MREYFDSELHHYFSSDFNRLMKRLIPPTSFSRVNYLLALCLVFLSLSIQASPQRPDFLANTLIKNYYDGRSDDLLTAGWSYQQISQRKLGQPAKEIDSRWLRKAAYFNNIIALIDTTNDGGYGRLFGPKIDQLPIAGFEYLSYSLDKNNQLDASLMLQVPDNMNWQKPCIVVAASSGSRGIYGAVGTVGSWALIKGCAVAYTDKGTGAGFYFFDSHKGFDIEGNYTNSENVELIYSEKINDVKQEFIDRHPTAIASKQAYSGKNIEKDFGRFVIQAAEFALYQLNQHSLEKKQSSKRQFNRENTLIIVASISNGGAASLKAGELDQSNLIDGIVVAEPNIYPKINPQLKIFEGDKQVAAHSLAGYDYFSAINLFSRCALLTNQAKKAPFWVVLSAKENQLIDWCESLKNDQLIVGDNTHELANDALKKLSSLGIKQNNQTLAPISEMIELWPALAATYANQLGRYSLEEQLCGVYFSAENTSQKPSFLLEQQRISLPAMGNGIPPTAGIKLKTTQDQSAYKIAKCFYQHAQQRRVRNGIQALISDSNLNQIPTIILHGQNDQLIQPNHTSRPYFANAVIQSAKVNKTEFSKQNIRYYEVKNAQHFDAFIALPQFAGEYIPLHFYFEQGLELMLDLLENSAELPPSQVINTKSRKSQNGVIEALEKTHLPAISSNSKNEIKLLKPTAKEKQFQLIIPH